MLYHDSSSAVLAAPAHALETDDVNLEVCGLLQDLAQIYKDHPKHSAYRRAAGVVAGLDRPITDLVLDDHVEKLPGIGRSIERLIVQYVHTGSSEIVDRALAAASREIQAAVAKRRLVRKDFLSIARAREVLWGTTTAPTHGRRVPVTASEYNGDLQQHSLWSDGSETIEQIVEDSLQLGQKWAAVTDHFGLSIANGLTAADFVAQHVEIDGINEKYSGQFTLLKGVEANIREDGIMDAPVSLAETMDVVVASPHSLLRREQDQTARMVNAVRQPAVHILGHPRGRKFNDREGIKADWDEVFRAAADSNVAIEIDGSWERQDIDFSMAANALKCGCIFALDSDAHYRRERHFSGIAIAHARLAGIPADRIVNCWPLDRFLGWSESKK